jgi:hypothetical protein
MKKLLPLIATALMGFQAMAGSLEIRDSKTMDKLYVIETNGAIEFNYCEQSQPCRTLGMKAYTRAEFEEQAKEIQEKVEFQRVENAIYAAAGFLAPVLFFKVERIQMIDKLGKVKGLEASMPKSFGYKLGSVMGSAIPLANATIIQEDLSDKESVTNNVLTLDGDDQINSVEQYVEVLGEVLTEIEMRRM